MIPLCRYILQGGNPCQQAAITGEHYCRHHLVVRRTVAANTPKQNPYRIEKPLALVFPEDRAALMIDVFVVMQAFNEGQISPKSANIYTRLLHECGVILKQGPLYDTDHENAVRRVVVTEEGEEIAPAREVPETGLRAQGTGPSEEPSAASEDSASSEDCASSEDSASSETRFAQDGETVSEEAVGGECANPPFAQTAREGWGTPSVSVPRTSSSGLCGPPSDVPHTSNGGLCGPPSDDFACGDPCYIENLTQRREQYRKVATYELAAGLDPRPWEKFLPGKSKVKRPKTLVG